MTLGDVNRFMPRSIAPFRPLVFVFTIAALWCGCQRRVTTLEELIARNTKAMGGEAAIEAVQSVAVDLHIVDPGFAVDGTYIAARPGKMRIDIRDGGKNIYTEAFDGVRGWQWKGQGDAVVDESPKATATLRHGVELPGHLYGLHEMRRRGHQIEFSGEELIDGTSYYAVRMTMKDGYVTTLFIDPKTWLITRRRDVRALHIDVDPSPTTMEQRMSDFREVSGVMFPFANSEIDLKTGKVLETTTARTITVNPKVDPARFEKL